MKNTIYHMLIAASLLISGNLFSQEETSSSKQALTIAFDPATTALLGGYEIELGFNSNKSRFTAYYIDGTLPIWYGQAEEFESTSHSAIELSYSRFLNEEQKGFSYGIGVGYFKNFQVEDSLGQTLSKNPARIGIKLAYAWYPFDSFPLYIEPTVTLGTLIGDEDLKFTSGQIFDKNSLMGNGPLFNIGYKFNF